MTIAAITPPEGREEDFASPPTRAESAGAGEVISPLTGTVVLPITGVWRAVLDVTAAVLGVDVGKGDDDDGDSMIFDEAGRMELGTRLERGVATEVELPTAMLGVEMSAMLDACTVGGTGGVLRSPWLGSSSS